MKKHIITGIIFGGIGFIIGGKVSNKKIVKLLESNELKDEMTRLFKDELMKGYKKPIYKMGDLMFDSLADAEEVSDNLNDIIIRCGNATVRDLYDLIGISGTYIDNRYGWTEPINSKIESHEYCYVLKIDEPKKLKKERMI